MSEEPKTKAERLKAVRAEFDRIADAAREDYVRVVGQAQAECERAVRVIEREPDPMRPDPATKKERLKAAIAARKEADRKWEELTQARDAVGRAWLAADLLQREIEREP